MNDKVKIEHVYNVGKQVYAKLEGIEQHQLARSFVSEREAEIFVTKKAEEIKNKYLAQYYDFNKGDNQQWI